MYRLMLSDLDETLLTSDHHVPEINREAVRKARKKGLKFVPATGRGYEMTKEILHELEIDDVEGEYIISFNGGMILETKGFKELYFNGLSYEMVKQIFDFGKNYDVCMEIFTPEGCFLFNANQSEIDRKTKQKANFKVIDDYDMSFTKDMRIAKIIFQKMDVPYLKDLASKMTHITDGKVAVSYSSSRYLEFNALGVNKGAALKWLANYLQIPVEQTIAIGDNDNDITMLEQAGLGVAVACAQDHIKKVCQYVTKKDFYEGAVAETIDKFVLND